MATAMGSKAGAYFEKEGKEMVDRMEKLADTAREAVNETIDDGKVAAARLLKRGRTAIRSAVEDGVEEAVRQVKRKPVKSLAIAFAAGAAVGLIAPLVAKKGRG